MGAHQPPAMSAHARVSAGDDSGQRSLRVRFPRMPIFVVLTPRGQGNVSNRSKLPGKFARPGTFSRQVACDRVPGESPPGGAIRVLSERPARLPADLLVVVALRDDKDWLEVARLPQTRKSVKSGCPCRGVAVVEERHETVVAFGVGELLGRTDRRPNNRG
jgi:hypothetical protein